MENFKDLLKEQDQRYQAGVFSVPRPIDEGVQYVMLNFKVPVMRVGSPNLQVRDYRVNWGTVTADYITNTILNMDRSDKWADYVSIAFTEYMPIGLKI